MERYIRSIQRDQPRLEDDLNENGDQMSYRNPNTRFDHQETGGRFKGVLIRKGAGPEFYSVARHLPQNCGA